MIFILFNSTLCSLKSYQAYWIVAKGLLREALLLKVMFGCLQSGLYLFRHKLFLSVFFGACVDFFETIKEETYIIFPLEF